MNDARNSLILIYNYSKSSIQFLQFDSSDLLFEIYYLFLKPSCSWCCLINIAVDCILVTVLKDIICIKIIYLYGYSNIFTSHRKNMPFQFIFQFIFGIKLYRTIYKILYPKQLQLDSM